jgi:hypothetical protein
MRSADDGVGRADCTASTSCAKGGFDVARLVLAEFGSVEQDVERVGGGPNVVRKGGVSALDEHISELVSDDRGWDAGEDLADRAVEVE